MSEKIVNGLYFAVVALADLISIPYVLYTLSEIEKILNGIISCGRCFSQSRKFSISVMYTTPSMVQKIFIGVYIVFDAIAVLIKLHMCYIHLL